MRLVSESRNGTYMTVKYTVQANQNAPRTRHGPLANPHTAPAKSTLFCAERCTCIAHTHEQAGEQRNKNALDRFASIRRSVPRASRRSAHVGRAWRTRRPPSRGAAAMLASAPLDEAEEIGEEVEILVVMFSDLRHARAKVVSRRPPHAVRCPVQKLTCCSGCKCHEMLSCRAATGKLNARSCVCHARPAPRQEPCKLRLGREALRCRSGTRSPQRVRPELQRQTEPS